MFAIPLSVKISVKIQVMIRVYNVGAIFMAWNITATSCTKHLEIRFVKEYIEDEIHKILFVKSVEKNSDILMMNL